MIIIRWALPALVLCALAGRGQAETNSLLLPRPGYHELRVLSPSVLELFLVSTKPSQNAPVAEWDFAGDPGKDKLPAAEAFEVTASGKAVKVARTGFKRRVLYAPLKERDLRIGNHLYLELEAPLPPNADVAVKDRGGSGALKGRRFQARHEPMRYSPAVHANQTGYLPGMSKQAMVGYYLGSLGELKIANAESRLPDFALIATATGATNFQGPLRERADRGFPFNSYKRVYEADFSAFQTPGEYRLFVPGLGCSFPFVIGDEVAGWMARTYGLGLYHQRCGTNNTLPFTRFTHGVCHAAPAEVPNASFTNAQFIVGQSTEEAEKIPRHKAPRMKDTGASLYPFARKGKVEVSGGHHDAGDYSKYTANSAGLIHHLMTAVDAFSGVSDLDNLGIPESGDGKSDVLQEAKWEADFLAKMQDEDGGFYFLVYPRDRRYENDVPPDQGDSQIVWPKTTSATAAATAALAQCGSSPTMQKQFPESAKQYLAKARKGWEFLKRAFEKHGEDGAYQKITHYGHEFLHDDEVAWAACELFLATGEDEFHKALTKWLNPSDPATRKWSWVRMYEGYGSAVRSYALAKPAGKTRGRQDAGFVSRCESEMIAWAGELMKWSQESAYGTSFPAPTKRVRSAGWYFSCDPAFDLASALQLPFPKLRDPRPDYLKALLANLNYEAGGNPVNVSYITGLGWKRQREIVHQWAQNDARVLPPPGIPLGNVQGGFGWLDHYGQELGALTFPQDSAPDSPYPFYDRWGDSFNLSQEFVVLNQARGLATWAWLMAQTSLRTQPWKPAGLQITTSAPGTPRHRARLASANGELGNGRVLWEAAGAEPAFGSEFALPPQAAWIEAEVLLPDGRIGFAATNFSNSRLTQKERAR